MEYNHYKKKTNRCISFNSLNECNNDRHNSCIDYINNEFNNDEFAKLNIFTIIKNEIINVLTIIKKHEYNKNLDSSIIDALFILYNSINNLNNSGKEEIDINDFNNKLDIYYIAPFLNIIRNNNIFYKIKLNALHSLYHILKYNSNNFNEKDYEDNINSKQISYMSIGNEEDINNNQSESVNKSDFIFSDENNLVNVNDRHGENEIHFKINEKIHKKKKYHFFNRNYKFNKKYNSRKEENSNFLVNKGNNIINISIETLLNAPINYNNVSHEEIILYETIILFNNIICNAIRMVDKKYIIKIICYIFKIYKNNKYSLLFKGNCESLLVNAFYVIINNFMNNLDDDSINDLLIIVLILISSNKNKFIFDILKKKEYIDLYKDLFENEISNENMESINILSFRLLNILLEICGCSLVNKNLDILTNIIRCLFIHISSSSYILICKSMRLYVNIFILYKKNFFIYNEIYMNILLSILKKNSQKNITETALLTISHFCTENVLFELYYNYDINLYASDLLENFIQSILELCINFIQNTTIINEVIFKMIKSILYISSPYKICNDNKNSFFLNELNNIVSETSGYNSQLISDFKSDIYSNSYGNVLNSKLNKSFILLKNKNHKEMEDKKKKHKIKSVVIHKSATKEITEKVNKEDSKCFLNKNKKESQEIENEKNKIFSKSDEFTENLSKNDDLKKSNMNKLYSLNFLTSIKDDEQISFCSLLLFEHLKEYIKVQYIKKKKNRMRKKKLRKEILKKSANIFNTLKNKSIDELIKVKIIETQESFTKIDKINSTIDPLATNQKKNIMNCSSLSYEEKTSIINEVDLEKESNDKNNNNANNIKNINDNENNVSSYCDNINGISNNMNNTEREQEKSQCYNSNLTKETNLEVREIKKNSVKENDKCIDLNKLNEVKNEDINDEKNKCISHDISSGIPNKNDELNNKIDQNKSDDSKKIKSKDTISKEDKNEKLLKEEGDIKVEKDKKKDHAKEKDYSLLESNSSRNNSKWSNISNTQKKLIEDEYFLRSMTKFLRYNPFLDKEFIGEYISHRKNINILKHYVRLFDFCNLSLLSSLRLFLHYFKLPGEAQLIERILEHFSLCFFYSNPIYGDLDSVYKNENNKIVCLLKEEELSNIKRYILIDYLNDNTNDNNNDKTITHTNSNNNDDTNTDKDNNMNHCVDTYKNRCECDNSEDNFEYNIQKKINLKKNVDIKDYVHRNVYYISKKIQSMNEEEIKKKYVIVENSDVIFILTYSIIMLNTDLHNNQVKNKMKLEEFIKNNRGINNGKNIDRIYLENLYNCILNEEIKLFSNTQNSYTNDDQYWRLLEKKKKQYKKYHSIKERDAHFYKYDINKLIVRNNFLQIFFEIFRRTNDYNLTENCLCIFKMFINNLAFYNDLTNVNKLCYIFKYINFNLTQKSQLLLYLFFYFVKKCHNLFRDCWFIYINTIFKLVSIDLIPIFFYLHIYINNNQFNNDKDFLNGNYNKGNSLETYNINKSITEIYQHPFLVFKKNVKKLNKSKWIDEFSNIFFSKNNSNENNNLSIIFKENYSEKIEEDKKRKKKREEKQDHLNKENEKMNTQNNTKFKKLEDNGEDHDDDIEEDELNYIYVNIKVDPKNVDNSIIIDNINIYKRLKLDIYNFFTFNDFYNNMITNLNISSFVHLIKFLIIKCSINKENETNILNLGNKAELNNPSSKSQMASNSYLNNDKYNVAYNMHDHINDCNPVLVNSESSFDLFCCKKAKTFATQILFQVICFKINYTYVLYNILCKLNLKYTRKNNLRNMENNNPLFEKSHEDFSDIMNTEKYSDQSAQERNKTKEVKLNTKKEKKEEKKRNNFDLSLNNIYDTDNSSNSSLSDSVLSDVSNDSFIIKENETSKKELYLYLNEGDEKEQENQENQEETKNCKNCCEFNKVYAYADYGDDDEDEEDEEEKDKEQGEDEVTTDNNSEGRMEYCEKANLNHNKFLNGKINKNICMDERKEFLIDKIKIDLYMKTYIMHLKIIAITFEHFFKLLNNFLIINYNDDNIFTNIYNSVFKDYKMKNLKIKTEKDISNDDRYRIYDKNFEEIDKILNYKDEKIDITDIENKLFLVRSSSDDTEEWLFIEQLIMSIMNFSYICFNIYKDNKNKISKRKLNKMNYNNSFSKKYLQIKKKNKKFFFLCGIYLIYILQFLKKNILYRFIDKIIYVLEKISKNIYVNSCIINIYLHMLQLIMPNNILCKNTNNTNISLNDKDIYIYIEKATIYTESINNIINNNNVLLKLNNFNIENIILSLLPYLLFFNNKKEEINAHIASINSECLHIISNIYYKSIYMYMNNSKKNKINKNTIMNYENNDKTNVYRKNEDLVFDKIIELKKMYIFLLTCFVLSLACSFSSKKTRSEAYIKLQQFLFNENYIFKKVNKNEINNNNQNEKSGLDEKYVYKDEKLIDLISNFIILPLITYNYYFPFICKNMYVEEYNYNKEQKSKKENEANYSENNSINCLISKNNYCKEALLNFNLYNKKKDNDLSDNVLKNDEYENCGCIINYKNIETIDQDSNKLNNLFNYANDYYIHTVLHKQYNYYFSYLFAKKMLSYDNVCYRKSMSISFVSHIILSFLYSLLNCSGDMCDNNNDNSNINNRNIYNNDKHKSTEIEKEDNDSVLNDQIKNNHVNDENEEENDINLYELLCLNNEGTYNRIVTKTKCESNCIYYFLKHFYHALLTIKEEAKKILNIYKETFIENIKNIIYVSSSYAYSLKDHRINCFSHIKNGLFFLNEEEKNHLKSYNKQNMGKKRNSEGFDFENDVFKNILKLQANVRISISIVYYILYSDNSQNNQFKIIFEELLNVLLTKYNDNPDDLDEVNHCIKKKEVITEKKSTEQSSIQNEIIRDKENINMEQEEINKDNKSEENKKNKESKKNEEHKRDKEGKKNKENKKGKESKKDKENKKDKEHKKEKESKKDNDKEKNKN
ncbi:protein transport protein SEC7, putative [Plasmodium relictum]|uniref:Protein transport protein SEC7, putative n=1 Tax=Plasmodium relictum TaxID=85471 RepID=A0A1J1H950_PLARL|nr:protein transport protein SEC7, putative [Plasmodium relictum]CRH01497.1 protein transport protein SEC7, putative [Plasmodium relictum]